MAKSISQKVYERSIKNGNDEKTARRYQKLADSEYKRLLEMDGEKPSVKRVMDFIHAGEMTSDSYNYNSHVSAKGASVG